MASFSPDIVEALNVHLLEPLLFGRLLAAAGVRHSAHYVPFYLEEGRAWLSSALLPVVMCVAVVGERDGHESASSEPENRIKPTSCSSTAPVISVLGRLDIFLNLSLRGP